MSRLVTEGRVEAAEWLGWVSERLGLGRALLDGWGWDAGTSSCGALEEVRCGEAGWGERDVAGRSSLNSNTASSVLFVRAATAAV